MYEISNFIYSIMTNWDWDQAATIYVSLSR